MQGGGWVQENPAGGGGGGQVKIIISFDRYEYVQVKWLMHDKKCEMKC